MMNTPLWQPSKQTINTSQLKTFIRAVNERYQLAIDNYDALYDWSIKKPADFWQMLWDSCNVLSHTPYQCVVEHPDSMLGAQWFPGSTLNFAEHLLQRRDDAIALTAINEQGEKNSLSFQALYKQVASLAKALRHSGVKKGMRVVGFLPNQLEAVVAMLATTSIGAIWSSCSPDFGFQGVLDRFSQIEPTVLFGCDAYFYNGKTHHSLATIKALQAALPSVKQSIIIPLNQKTPDIESLTNTILWADYLMDCETLVFEAVPFNHPLYIMYSSGTTGAPKCIVHSVGGTILQHLKELKLHCDLKRDEKLFFFTTCGWMMWNWTVSGLALGASLILYDGAPTYPNYQRLFDLIDNESINVFGTSAKFLAACEKQGITPKHSHQLTSLRLILSTGSPLSPASFDYVYHAIKSDLQLSSISGGTDILSCFALGCPILPVYRGQLQCRGLGMDVAIYNSDGESVRGEKGELVCLSPFPSMPIYFWDDKAKKKYLAAYFERFQGIWAHGDYAELTAENGIIIYGRSDAILNPGGVRIGTAEIYRQVEKVDAVVDSVVIGQQWQDDVRVVLFVQLRKAIELTDELIATIKRTIRENTTPRHVPAKVIQVAQIPRTISGKIVEIAVKNTVEGEPINNLDALANPEALAEYKNHPQLSQ